MTASDIAVGIAGGALAQLTLVSTCLIIMNHRLERIANALKRIADRLDRDAIPQPLDADLSRIGTQVKRVADELARSQGRMPSEGEDD